MGGLVFSTLEMVVESIPHFPMSKKPQYLLLPLFLKTLMEMSGMMPNLEKGVHNAANWLAPSASHRNSSMHFHTTASLFSASPAATCHCECIIIVNWWLNLVEDEQKGVNKAEE